MKYIKILFVLVACVFASCSFPVHKYELRTNCSEDASRIFKLVEQDLTLNDFKIVESDPASGFLKAVFTNEGNPLASADFLGITKAAGISVEIEISWIINYRNGKISAMCHFIRYKKALGEKNVSKEIYCDDDISTKYSWYWDVRNKLASLCGGNIQIVEIENGK